MSSDVRHCWKKKELKQQHESPRILDEQKGSLLVHNAFDFVSLVPPHFPKYIYLYKSIAHKRTDPEKTWGAQQQQQHFDEEEEVAPVVCFVLIFWRVLSLFFSLFFLVFLTCPS